MGSTGFSPGDWVSFPDHRNEMLDGFIVEARQDSDGDWMFDVAPDDNSLYNTFVNVQESVLVSIKAPSQRTPAELEAWLRS